eukprot:SAG31_NODE_3485_length_4211_cov_2.074903_7_plen_163_part_00
MSWSLEDQALLRALQRLTVARSLLQPNGSSRGSESELAPALATVLEHYDLVWLLVSSMAAAYVRSGAELWLCRVDPPAPQHTSAEGRDCLDSAATAMPEDDLAHSFHRKTVAARCAFYAEVEMPPDGKVVKIGSDGMIRVVRLRHTSSLTEDNLVTVHSQFC